jgi:hypothetical protein
MQYMWGDEKYIQKFNGENLNRKDYVSDRGKDVRIILK